MRKGLLCFNEAPSGSVPASVKLLAIVFRSTFIIALLIVTAWVARPQFADNWLEHFTLGDLVRVLLGLGAGLWMLINLFILPKDAQGYRTWFYLGLAIMPLALLGAIVFW